MLPSRVLMNFLGQAHPSLLKHDTDELNASRYCSQFDCLLFHYNLIELWCFLGTPVRERHELGGAGHTARRPHSFEVSSGHWECKRKRALSETLLIYKKRSPWIRDLCFFCKVLRLSVRACGI